MISHSCRICAIQSFNAKQDNRGHRGRRAIFPNCGSFCTQPMEWESGKGERRWPSAGSVVPRSTCVESLLLFPSPFLSILSLCFLLSLFSCQMTLSKFIRFLISARISFWSFFSYFEISCSITICSFLFFVSRSPSKLTTFRPIILCLYLHLFSQFSLELSLFVSSVFFLYHPFSFFIFSRIVARMQRICLIEWLRESFRWWMWVGRQLADLDSALRSFISRGIKRMAMKRDFCWFARFSRFFKSTSAAQSAQFRPTSHFRLHSYLNFHHCINIHFVLLSTPSTPPCWLFVHALFCSPLQPRPFHLSPFPPFQPIIVPAPAWALFILVAKRFALLSLYKNGRFIENICVLFLLKKSQN